MYPPWRLQSLWTSFISHVADLSPPHGGPGFKSPLQATERLFMSSALRMCVCVCVHVCVRLRVRVFVYVCSRLIVPERVFVLVCVSVRV